MATTDDADIRALIEGWAEAIRTFDLDGIVAGHTDDIVMFDVPPPYTGVRGLADYRAVWPPFFEYIRSGAQFEILELDVQAGGDVAVAFALLRCGTPEEYVAKPDNWLRLTMGLVKVNGRWMIRHEHHSFAFTD